MLKNSIQTSPTKRIIGIDPGTVLCGFGIVEKNAHGLLALPAQAGLRYGCIRNAAGGSIDQKLLHLNRELKTLLRRSRPDLLALEKVFFFKNAKTVIDVARAQGVILAAAAELNVPIVEFTPLEVKQAVTGYGRAEKAQIQNMTKRLLNLKEVPRPDDAADALALAICAAHSVQYS